MALLACNTNGIRPLKKYRTKQGSSGQKSRAKVGTKLRVIGGRLVNVRVDFLLCVVKSQIAVKQSL